MSSENLSRKREAPTSCEQIERECEMSDELDLNILCDVEFRTADACVSQKAIRVYLFKDSQFFRKMFSFGANECHRDVDTGLYIVNIGEDTLGGVDSALLYAKTIGIGKVHPEVWSSAEHAIKYIDYLYFVDSSSIEIAIKNVGEYICSGVPVGSEVLTHIVEEGKDRYPFLIHFASLYAYSNLKSSSLSDQTLKECPKFIDLCLDMMSNFYKKYKNSASQLKLVLIMYIFKILPYRNLEATFFDEILSLIISAKSSIDQNDLFVLKTGIRNSSQDESLILVFENFHKNLSAEKSGSRKLLKKVTT